MSRRSERKALYIRVDEETLAEIEARRDGALADARNKVIERDLKRYYYFVARSGAHLARIFSDDEQALIVNALKGALFTESSMRVLVHQIEDAISLDGLDGKWSVDGGALVEKLEARSEFERGVIADGAERFWASVPAGEDLDARGWMGRMFAAAPAHRTGCN